jgi:hypothetical protein
MARLTARRDALAHGDFFATPVGVVNDHAVKLNWRVLHSDLNPPEQTGSSTDHDPVAVHPAVHTRLSQINPATMSIPLRTAARQRLRVDGGADTQTPKIAPMPIAKIST